MINDLLPSLSGAAELTGKEMPLPKALRLENGGFAPYCTTAFFARSGVEIDSTAPDTLRLIKNEALSPEGYRINIAAHRITVAAAQERGVIWALGRVYAMRAALPQGTISEAPKLPHRGLSFDSARHFFSITEIEKIIEEMSQVGMNVFHWHLTDDQSWRIELECAPKLNKVCREYYTKAEIRHVVSFAQERGVEVIPEIDMPGHVSTVLCAYPQLGCSGKRVNIPAHGGVFEDIFCAGKPEVMRFIEEILAEVCPLFPSRKFHIGGDEAPKTRWKSCPLCQAKMKRLGLQDEEALQAEFICEVADILKRHGKTPICWNEALLAGRVPKNIEVQYWLPGKAQRMPEFTAGGGKYIYSNVYELYFDYPHAMTSLERVYALRPEILGRPCESDSGFAGIECCIWQEHIHDDSTLEKHIFPRLYAVAEICWSGAGEYTDFARRVQQRLKSRPQLKALPPQRWNVQGQQRRADMVEFLRKMCNIPANMPAPIPAEGELDKDAVELFIRYFCKKEDIPYIGFALIKKQ